MQFRIRRRPRRQSRRSILRPPPPMARSTFRNQITKKHRYLKKSLSPTAKQTSSIRSHKSAFTAVFRTRPSSTRSRSKIILESLDIYILHFILLPDNLGRTMKHPRQPGASFNRAFCARTLIFAISPFMPA